MLPNIRIDNVNLTNFKVLNHYFDAHAKRLGNETDSAYEAYIYSIQSREGSQRHDALDNYDKWEDEDRTNQDCPQKYTRCNEYCVGQKIQRG